MQKRVYETNQSDTLAELTRVRAERESLHKERELLKEQYEENMQSARDQWQRQVKEYKKDRVRNRDVACPCVRHIGR